MYKNALKIFEFGVSSGNNATYLAKKVGNITSNFKYVATEHPSSIEQAKQTTIEQLEENGVNSNHFEFVPQTFEEFKPLEEKADLIVASHCLAFCQKDKFYEFMQNITNSVKDGGVFMGELYLDKMGPRFMLNQSSAIQLLQGKIDGNGSYVHPQDINNNSIFSGFDVKAQVKYNGQLVHFVATKTNCKGTTFEQTEKLVDYSDKQIMSISEQYSQVSKSAEAKEHRGDWVNYAQIYKGISARPLVHAVFESEQGAKWLEERICQNNLDLNPTEDLQKEILPFGQTGTLQTEETETQDILNRNNHQDDKQNFYDSNLNGPQTLDITTINQTSNTNPVTSKTPTQTQDLDITNPDSWSVHFNSQTDKLPKGNKFGKEYDDLPPSAREELESVMPKSLYPTEEQDIAPVQTLKPTTTDTTDITT